MTGPGSDIADGRALVARERVGVGLDDYRRELLSLVEGPRVRYPSRGGLPVVEALGRVLADDVAALDDVRDGIVPDERLVVSAGTPVAAAGRRIDAGLAAALLTAGITRVPVWLPPRVAVVVVASAPDPAREPGGGSAATGGLLRTHLCRLGVDPVVEHAASDRVGEVLDRLVANGHGLVLLAGGPTDLDVVEPVPWLSGVSAGGFRAVRVSPGRRQGWLRRGGTLVVCVPGDPFAASVTCDLLIRPLVLRMSGVSDERAEYGWLHGLKALAETGWASLPGVREAMPVRLRLDSDGVLLCSPVGEPDLPQVSDLADADALVLVPEQLTAVAPDMPLRLWAITR